MYKNSRPAKRMQSRRCVAWQPLLGKVADGRGSPAIEAGPLCLADAQSTQVEGDIYHLLCLGLAVGSREETRVFEQSTSKADSADSRLPPR